MMHHKSDGELVAAKKKILALLDDGVQLAKYALRENASSQENDCILLVLNSREFIAGGIREGAFDEKTYKRLQCQVFLRDWRAMEGYVSEFRRTRDRPTLFQEFEWLAKRWQADPQTLDP